MNQTLLTNNTAIPLSMAVWLALDEYDHNPDDRYISATGLIKSTRQIILGQRLPPQTEGNMKDISQLMASRIGTAVHSSIESSWLNHYKSSLKRLRYSDKVIARVKINPKPEELTPETIPIYMELRSMREIDGVTIGGKFDFIGNGTLEDFKTTGVYSYTSGSNDWKYKLQGSIYRWLNPELITNDHMIIDYIFTDWSRRDSCVKADKGYPPTKVFAHKILLLSLPETEMWIKNKIAAIKNFQDQPEANLPLCNAQELWQDAPTYKYYKNPEKTLKSTKNFNTSAEATIRWIEDGKMGQIVTQPGKVTACKYCDAFSICSQKDNLIASGLLQGEGVSQ